MRRVAIVFAALTLSLAPAAGASAQIGPLPPAQPPAPEPEQPVRSDKDDGLSNRQQLLIFGGAVVLIGLIAWFILRDARRNAPVAERPRDADAPKLSARERERAQRQKRDKAKAARQQRKRNRRR